MNGARNDERKMGIGFVQWNYLIREYGNSSPPYTIYVMMHPFM